jgi:UNC-50 family
MTDFGVICRMYAFDVHCNSYFPLFLLLYGEPLPVLP